jgi:hypothetical protein
VIIASATYAALDKAWRSTCRVLFGRETCSLNDASAWLKELQEKLLAEKSEISGKPVVFSMPDYSPSAVFISFDEASFGKKFAPLSLNEMKDIDSLVGAVQERAFYAGNVVLGHSSFVENSCNVQDSHFVLDSSGVADSKYVAFSRYVRRSEYIFGQHGADKNSYNIKCVGAELKRCFECNMVEVLSDCYYCAKAQNCIECMFCFGTENASHCIGNTRLPKDKYSALKKKLLSEIAEKLKKDGKAFSVLELLGKCSSYPHDSRLKFKKVPEAPFDIKPIEKAFSGTSRLLFGKELSGLEKYEQFFQRHTPVDLVSKSALSGNRVLSCGYRAHFFKIHDLERRFATDDELREIGKIGIGEEAASRLSIDAGKAAEIIHPICYYNLDKVAGNNANFKDCTVLVNSQDVYKSSAPTWSKKCAYGFWPSVCEAVFGSVLAFDSTFSMNCYYSKNLTRAFECDSCESCSDIYFAHNCENVRDSMFCFNAKNLAHAIGNAELPLAQYKQVKGALVAQMADELEKRHDLRWDIFNIGAAHKK